MNSKKGPVKTTLLSKGVSAMFQVSLAEGKGLEVAAEDQFMAVGRAWENGCPQQPPSTARCCGKSHVLLLNFFVP